MRKILIIFAHPRLERSRANMLLLKHIPDQDNITLHDLYEKYPDFNIDVEAEKELLGRHDVIVWHHPFYWYSCPPLLKQWIDMVLEFGWAYGPGGIALKDKLIFNTITTGGARESYGPEGHNRFTIKELLAPFEQTARLCKMTYLPPFAVQGTHKLTDEQLLGFAEQYTTLLTRMSENFCADIMSKQVFLNDICTLNFETQNK
jgi:glutathione-regulated potassium-efflux system ancillary protein KefG